ncbi:MAG: hypothetical protein FWF18_04485 [Dehalococcoidia bacterium]|nr:hypothetical protein [Dehalococcoidia bacterium]
MSLAQVHPGGSAATEGSGGGGNHPPPPPDASSLAGSFLQHGFTPKSILGSRLGGDEGSGGGGVIIRHLLRMLCHLQARSSSMDL